MRLSLNRIIAKAFIFFLTYQMFLALQPAFAPFGAQAFQASFLFHVLGLIVLICQSRGKIRFSKTQENRLFANFLVITILTYITSLVMAIYVYAAYGNYNGTSPFIAVTKLFLDFIQYGLIIFYVKYVFELIGTEAVLKCLRWQIRFSMLMGFIQLGVIKGISVFDALYKLLSQLFKLFKVTPDGGISLFLLEPSHAAIYMGIIVIPYYYANIISGRFTRLRDKTYVWEMILWVPLILFSKSTTMYLAVFAAAGVGSLIILFRSNASKGLKIIMLGVFTLGVIIITNPELIDKMLGIRFSYLLTAKIKDMENQSTASRMIPVLGNLLIFAKFPLLGCGNGLQGYFYKDIIPASIRRQQFDQSTYELLNGTGALANGSNFLTGILSGYGIVGTVLFALFFSQSIVHVRKRFSDCNTMKWIYLIALLPLLLSSVKSEFIGVYYVWFILSIPMVRFLDGEHEVTV